MENKYSSLAATIVSRRGGKSKWPLILGCLGILGVILAVIVVGGYIYFTMIAVESQSVVFIRTPSNGERLETGQPVQVRALARDDHKVTRIELWVDGQLLDVQTSNTPNGINPFPLLATWYPPEGTHTLIVRAFNSRGAKSQSTIAVEAAELADQDMDGTADEADLCPAEQGYSAADGCPDRDFDGIADGSDACPEETGLPEDGCPAPSEGDRDGDGTLDEADACPDVPGPPGAEGCLDGDGDGVADDRDACPEEPGDGEDGCAAKGFGYEEPEPFGVAPPEPFPGSEAPVPGADELPEGGSIPPGWGVPIALVDLELEALEMRVTDDYDGIRCWAWIYDSADARRYDFEPLGDMYWDIAAELGGENSEPIPGHDDETNLPVGVECWGLYDYVGGLVFLGRASGEYGPDDWYGQEQELVAYPPGSTIYGFSIKFRICIVSCDATPIQAPILSPVISNPFGGGHLIYWRWDDGGLEGWTHFRLARFVNGSWSNNLDIYNLEMRFMGVSDYAPACGEVVEFRIQYAAGVDFTTPWSNTVTWEGEPCTYTARVSFRSLNVHNPPADEGGHRQPGPIYGEFWATTGSAVMGQVLGFDACRCPRHGACRGLKLDRGTFSISGIFDWIDTQKVRCGIGDCDANSFDAPLTTSIHLPVTEGEDISFGGLIMDCDKDNPDDVLFRQASSYRINWYELAELDYLTSEIPIVLQGDHVDLHLGISLMRP